MGGCETEGKLRGENKYTRQTKRREDREEESKWENRKKKGIKTLAPAAPSCAVLILNHCSIRRDCLAFHLENRDLLPRRGLLLVRVPICGCV